MMYCQYFSVCGFQHFQRGGNKHFGLFESLWFVIVTFSTVGYGDVAPDIWPSKTFMMCVIIAVFIVLPTQVSSIDKTKKKKFSNYCPAHCSGANLCVTSLICGGLV